MEPPQFPGRFNAQQVSGPFYHRCIVTRAGVFQLAIIYIQNADKRGDEKAFTVVAIQLRFDILKRVAGLAMTASQCSGQGLGNGHEQAGRQTLARYVADGHA